MSADREPVIAYVALGANLGDARQTVLGSLAALDQLPGTRCTGRSRLYRTAPFEAQGPDFINAVARLETRLSAPELLDALQALENQAQPVTVVKETEPATDKKKDTQNKAVVRANAETVTTVRVRPLEPNAQKTPFTRQLSTRRVVTVDIIEVNTGEDKADQ